MIEVSGITKKYGDNTAVNDISFTIDKGRIYGFLGPNGAGKSTTMNIMTGYLAATQGTVKINGHDIVEEPIEAKKAIGYLPEIPPLYTDMTVREYLNFVAELKKIPAKDRKEQIDKVLYMVRIMDVEGRLIGNLSKGYRQNVGLCQAILGNPEYIILDEPTVGLDPRQIIHVRNVIKELSKEHTVILSSHILSEISEVCDYIIIIAGGKLVAQDTAQGLSERYNDSNALELTIKGEPDAVQSRLVNILGKVDIRAAHSAESGASDISITMPRGEDLREKIFYGLARENMTILKMNRQNMSLEDIFLTLTGSGIRRGRV